MMNDISHASWRVPGLVRPHNLKGIAALRELAERTDATLVEDLLQWCLELRQHASPLESVLEGVVGVPVAEMTASPFAFRASVMGLNLGVGAVHEECRTQGHWPRHLNSDDPSIEVGGDIWNHGKLLVRKYASFCQDFPFLSFHPEHSSKWTPHEMIHRVLGFFFRNDMTRFECYLGTRLNESIPVALWYGLDRLARLDEDPNDAPVVGGEHHRASLEQCNWLGESEKELKARLAASVSHFRTGVRWILSEWDAVLEELKTGRVCPRPGGYLDGSGDAMAYVVAHWNRLQDREVQATLTNYSRLGEHRFESIPSYMVQWEEVIDALFFQSLTGDGKETLARRNHRVEWDLAMLPLLIELGGEEMEEEESVSIVPGYAWELHEESNIDWAQLVDGLESIFPVTLNALGECDPEAHILTHFVEERTILDRSSLGLRFLETLSCFEASFVEELAKFEWLLAHGLKRSDQGERLGMDYAEESLDKGVLLAHPHFDLRTLPPDMLHYYNDVMGQEDTEPVGVSVFLMGKFGADVVMLPAPPPIAGIWLHLKASTRHAGEVQTMLDVLLQGQVFPESWPQGARGWIKAMIDVGALQWTPPWKGIVVDEEDPSG